MVRSDTTSLAGTDIVPSSGRRDHLVHRSSAIRSRSLGPRDRRARAIHPLLERVPSRSQTPRHGCGQNVARRTRTPLTADARTRRDRAGYREEFRSCIATRPSPARTVDRNSCSRRPSRTSMRSGGSRNRAAVHRAARAARPRVTPTPAAGRHTAAYGAGGGYSAGGTGGGGGYGGGGYRDRGPREMFSATCSNCGREAQVPFRPTSGKPVYCSDCFRSIRGA